jgi:ribosomal protein L32
MSKEVKGTLLGLAGSLIGIVLWVALSYFGVIAGIAGAFMGYVFVFIYHNTNKNDKSNYPYIAGLITIFCEIIISEFIVLAIIAASHHVPFGEIFEITGIVGTIIFDISIGLVLSGVAFGSLYLAEQKRAKALAKENADGEEKQTNVTNKCPSCGALLKDGVCPYCGIETDTKKSE